MRASVPSLMQLPFGQRCLLGCRSRFGLSLKVPAYEAGVVGRWVPSLLQISTGCRITIQGIDPGLDPSTAFSTPLDLCASATL